MSKHLPNCPHLSPYDGLGTAGINEIMGQRGANCTREYTVTIETVTPSESADTTPQNERPDFKAGYMLGYLIGYEDAVEDSDKTYYKTARYPHGDRMVIISWQEKKELWRSQRED